LRQRHQPGALGHHDGAGPKRPGARNGAEQGRFARARGAGDQHALAGGDDDVVGGDQRRTLRQPDQQIVDFDRIAATVGHYLDRRLGGGGGARVLGRDLEAVQPRDHGAPLRELAVGGDEERQRGLHAVERGRRLHQAAELDRAREIGRADHHERKHDRDLRVAGGEEGEPFGPLHDQHKVGDHLAEAVEQPIALRGLAGE
jgi:hypothetical protein